MRNFYSTSEYQEIAELFGLGKVKSIQKIHQGLWTPKAKVFTQKGGFIVSRYKIITDKEIIGKSKSSLQHEIDLMNHLKNLPVLKYVKSEKGNYIEVFRNSWVTVDRLIKGNHPKRISSKMAYQLGRFLASFHQKGKSFPGFEERRKFYDFPNSVVMKMEKIASKNKNMILKDVVSETKSGVLKNTPLKNLPGGPIHVDLKPGNELFIGEKLNGVVDFGNFYHGPFMVDIGKTIMWNCCKNKRLDSVLVKEFLLGYESKRRLDKFERSYLKKSILFAIYGHIWVDLYHVPIGYIPEEYTVNLVKTFLPIARKLEKENLSPAQSF